MNNNDIQKLMDRYEIINNKVTKLQDDTHRESIALEMAKTNLQEKMTVLQGMGVQFTNISELEAVLGQLSSQLDSVLSSTERKLTDIGM